LLVELCGSGARKENLGLEVHESNDNDGWMIKVHQITQQYLCTWMKVCLIANRQTLILKEAKPNG